MTLSRAVNADKILHASQEHSRKTGRTGVHDLLEKETPQGHTEHSPRYDIKPLPKHSLPSHSTDAEVTYQLIHDELTLDGNPLLNLASFVHTWMPPQADKLMAENVMKNLIDSDEYPATTLIHTRCISMIAKLWHAPSHSASSATGTATTGSSEAIQLAGLAMKKIWQEKTKKAGKDEYRPGPNVIMGANAQVALEKFARYFDVECRLVNVSKETDYVMSPKKAMELVDENTIGVFVILGSTYTGTYENVQEMSDLLDEYEKKTGNSVPIHVDGASGAFFAPFASPDLKWDFRLPRVVSINASGHKWGKAYVGVGWVIWRDKAHLPKDLIFELHYLGSTEYSFSLNFSRPAAPIIAQYFNFIHLGFEGYRRISLHDSKNARLLSRALERSTYYEVVSKIHLSVEKTTGEKIKSAAGLTDNIDDYIPGLPVVAFKFSDKFKEEYPHIKQAWVQTLLRAKAWIAPNYAMPPDAADVEILRVVIREQFTEDLVERFVIDLIEVTEGLMNEKGIIGYHAAEKGGHGHNSNEKKAASHGQGSQASGHDSVC